MTKSNSQRNSNRSLFLRAHRTLGIFIGILLMIIGTTGSILVFHDEIETALQPQLIKVVPQEKRLSLDAITKSIKQADKDAQIEFMLLPQKPEESLKVKLKSKNREIAVFANPYTGAILGWWGFNSIVTHFLLKIHMTLLAGKVGEIVVGICGLFLLILCITGLRLWSGWRRLIPAFKVRWKAPLRLFAFDLHQVSGILAVVFLSLISITGIFFVVAHNSSAFLSMFVTRPSEVELIAIAKTAKPISITEAIQIADRELPNSKTTYLAFAEKERKITVHKKYPEDIFPSGLSSVSIDRHTKKVLSVQKVLKPSFGNRVAKLIVDFHFGTFGGMTSKVIYVFVGLSPTVLFITGLTIYRLRTHPQTVARVNRELINR